MNERWTIGELVEVAGRALATICYEGQPTARVRERPDPRTIRYYTTLGLLDRPAELRGRTAYYGRRHVLQLVAIKRLQSQGRSLVEVQQALWSADDATLETLAGVPAEFWQRESLREGDPSGAPHPNAAEPSRTTRPAFWKESPAVAVDQSRQAVEGGLPVPDIRTFVELELAPGIRLVLEDTDSGQITAEAVAQLAPQAGQLVEQLRRLGWVR